MKPETKYSFVSTSAKETRHLAEEIGKRIRSGVVIRLQGDLGSGKTCFVKGLARGLEVPDGYEITSPTYTLVHEYPARLPFVHVDLYRIYDEMDAEAIGMYELMDEGRVVAVEWAERLSDDFWPSDRTLTIEFQSPDENTRRLSLFAYGLQITDLIKEFDTFWNSISSG